jgi:DNA-binding NarL/FixJ family response regulator
MVRSDGKPVAAREASLPPLPVAADHWQAMIDAMKLSPQQAKVAELMVRGAQLKEIASILGIKACSVRNQQERMYAKLGIRCGKELFAHILGVSYQVYQCRCGQK